MSGGPFNMVPRRSGLDVGWKGAAERSQYADSFKAAPMTNVERRRLEALLFQQLRSDIDECRRIGYRGTAFSRMMAKYGPIEACRKVIVASKLPDGFLKLL